MFALRSISKIKIKERNEEKKMREYSGNNFSIVFWCSQEIFPQIILSFETNERMRVDCSTTSLKRCQNSFPLHPHKFFFLSAKPFKVIERETEMLWGCLRLNVNYFCGFIVSLLNCKVMLRWGLKKKKDKDKRFHIFRFKVFNKTRNVLYKIF